MKKLLTLLAVSAAGLLSAAPVNTVCPVGARPIRTDVTSKFKDKEVAFCCTKCKAKFDANPAAYADKIK